MKRRTPLFGILLLALSFGSARAGDYSLYEPARLVARADYTLGMVFIERWRGNYFLGVERVIPVDEYLDYQLTQSVTETWQEKARRSQEQQELAADASGLIPDIELPKLPIFGEGSRIDISGKDRITFGGRQTFVRGIIPTPGQRGIFPELKMEQQLSVILNGTIGERTKVNIDHDSERQEDKNKILLSYTGTEDEVVQSVELGDTRLTIPGTGYTGDLPAHHGLFGATAKGKVGGVDVYAIASREESQNQTANFPGQRRASVDTIYDGEYVKHQFFYIDAPSAARSLRVYIDDKNPGNNQSAYKGIATVWPDRPDSVPDTTAGSNAWTYDRAVGDFDLKGAGKDFVIHPGNVIEFLTALNERDVVGLVIFTESDTIGGQEYNDSLVLKLLKPELTDSSSLTWDYELRNVYSLRDGEEVTLNSFRLYRDVSGSAQDIENEDAGQNSGRKFTDILGLDPNGDGRLEYPLFDSKTGLIRFPTPKPFASTGLSVRDSVIYRRDLVPGSPEGRAYYMVAEYSKRAESFYLQQVDITENSEKVIVNGEQWTRDVDYTVNYKTGILSFIKPLPADANIQVTFEYRPLFSLAQKSLVGTRAEWNLSQQGKVGASVFYRSEGIPEDKPSLGSEPFRRMIAEADASYNYTSDAVSAFLDRLPLLRAQAPSSFGASAEGAVSLPDPNTRGVAYLDDFEGTSITRDVSITGILWSWGSTPLDKDSSQFARAPLYWINPTEKVRNDSVFGPQVGDEGKETHDILKVIYAPDSGNPETWAGMMTSPSQMGMNLKDIDNLQMVLKTRRNVGTIHVTVGMSIDEDAPRRSRAGLIVGMDGMLNTEDRNSNGVLDEGVEDTGLDTLYGADTLFPQTPGDDGNDDYDAVKNPMGMENNRRVDGEDLDRSGFSRYNHYFECDIPLGDARYFTLLHGGWQLCRVSLHDTLAFRTIGRPKWEDIRLVRVWFDQFEATDTIDFYSIEFTGSRWGSASISALRDTTHIVVDTTEKVWVAQVSKKTDTSYVPPFELKRDASGKLETEAALLLGYQHLYGNRRAVIFKTSADREDYRDYSDLRMYVHDDGNDLAFLLRLGADSVNYYEYRAPVKEGMVVPGRDGKWYEFLVTLDSFPLLKARRDSIRKRGDTLTSGPYRIRGNPSLSDVRYTALGIEHPDRRKIDGGLWFDDMRLTGPRKEPGYGFQARTALALSDFINLGLSFIYSDPNFRRFSEGRAVKVGGFGTSVNTSVHANLDRLMPFGWGLTVPLTYSVADQRDLPKYAPDYPDLRLSRDQAQKVVSTGQSQDISLDNLRKQKSGNKWLNYTVEGMGFSWREHWGRNHTALTQDSAWATTYQWAYAISPDLKLNLPGDRDLSFLPQTIRYGLTDSRRKDQRSTWRRRNDSTMVMDTLRDSLRSHGVGTDFGVEYTPIEDLNFDYGVTTERDLEVPDSVTEHIGRVKTGKESGREHNFSAGYNIEVGDFVTPSVDFNGDYSDDRLKSGATYADLWNMNNSGELDFTLGLDLPELLGRIEPPKRPKPQTRSSKPPTPAPRPQSEIPKPESLGLEPESLPPRPGPLSPEPESLLPRPESLLPKPESLSGKPDSLRPKPDSADRKPDSLAPKSESLAKKPPPEPPTPGPNMVELFQRGAASLSDIIEPLDASYGITRSSDLVAVQVRAPWKYRLGFDDKYWDKDSSKLPTSMNRELHNTLRLSSGGRVRELTARLGYEWSEGRNINDIFGNATLDRSTTWPDIDLTLGKVHNLFKRYATDSKLSSGFRRRFDIGGELIRDSAGRETLSMYGRTESKSNEFSPLASWQTTWKKKITSTISANYTLNSAINYLNETGDNRTVANTYTRGADLSLSYTFSAPQGIRLPFLKRLRFTSDLSVNWSLRYSQTIRTSTPWVGNVPVKNDTLQRDNSFGTNLAASYRFSRSIEAGLTTGYTKNRNQSGISTETMDVDVWVLFRF